MRYQNKRRPIKRRKKRFLVEIWEYCAKRDRVIKRKLLTVEARDKYELYGIMDRKLERKLEGYDYEYGPEGTYFIRVKNHEHLIGYNIKKVL